MNLTQISVETLDSLLAVVDAFTVMSVLSVLVDWIQDWDRAFLQRNTFGTYLCIVSTIFPDGCVHCCKNNNGNLCCNLEGTEGSCDARTNCKNMGCGPQEYKNMGLCFTDYTFCSSDLNCKTEHRPCRKKMEQQASVVQQMMQACHQIKETCTNAQEVQGGADLAKPRCNPTEDASALEKAITAKGVDEGTIIDILTKRTNEQRQEIKVAYQKKTGKTLEESLKKALSGKLQTLMLDLIKTPAQLDAHVLKRATKGLGTDEDAIIEICVTRTNQQKAQIKKVYSAEFQTDLEKDIIADTSGDFQKAIVALLKGTRSEDCYVNEALADQDAKALYEAGEKKKKADAAVFIEILTIRSFSHLQQVFKMYGKYSKHNLSEALDLELKGDIEKCLVAIVKFAMNKPAYFAEKVHLAMKGVGTREQILNRVIISRSEIDMKSIKAQYHQMFKTSMRDDIMKETSGNYETAMVGLIGYDV